MNNPTEILNRATLADQIADRLLAQMRADSMRPGDQLPSETRLAELYAVSRPVVREALMKLKSLGMIDVSSGRPPVVQAIDGRLPGIFFESSVAMNASDIRELLEVRRGLEIQSAILAAQHARNDDRIALMTLAEEMGDLLRNRDFETFIDLDVRLHVMIAEASRNRMLRTLVEAIREPMRKSIGSGLNARVSDTEFQRIHKIHLDIVGAIALGEELAAAEAMARHFDEALASILSVGHGSDGAQQHDGRHDHE